MSDATGPAALYAMHDALRRELAHLDRVTTSAHHDPRHVLATAPGWQLLKKALHAHQSAADEALWPPLRHRLTGRPRDLVVLAVMEAEHAAIAPVVEAIDATLADPGADALRLGQLTDALAGGLAGHLAHREDAALPLLLRALTAEQWDRFGRVQARRIGRDAPLLLPWLLDGADEPTVATLLAPLPASEYAAYLTRWAPAYALLDRWSAGTAT
ncbi:hemerythrin domain-containing protein [Streptomyces flavofungini]|uniref:hemerythrin domain-containing protein n=1 Tax=Streptomyces flavofungini TaxID=68200 RepID=UPI0025B016ED|nr:hemerythrin domain-containing protein [Streptomyces flavofungini]WJV48274.1 hemerythrin domain-containing protein [Streptomyces flavofungini]